MTEEVINIKRDLIEFQIKVKKFKKDAKNHINYLIIILCIFMVYFIETKFFNDIQFLTVSFLIVFQLAFIKNMILNVPSR